MGMPTGVSSVAEPAERPGQGHSSGALPWLSAVSSHCSKELGPQSPAAPWTPKAHLPLWVVWSGWSTLSTNLRIAVPSVTDPWLGHMGGGTPTEIWFHHYQEVWLHCSVAPKQCGYTADTEEF